MKSFAVILLTLAALARADTPLFLGRYGYSTDPVTPRDRLAGIWTMQTALEESTLAKEKVQNANERLVAAAKDLIPLWRASESNLGTPADLDKKAEAIWSKLETDINPVLGPPGMEELTRRCIVVYVQELITPCPDAVWGAEDFLKLNFTAEQKKRIDDAFTQATEESEQRWKAFRETIKEDPNQITWKQVESLRLQASAPRRAARSHMTADQLKRWDEYILSEFKADAEKNKK